MILLAIAALLVIDIGAFAVSLVFCPLKRYRRKLRFHASHAKPRRYPPRPVQWDVPATISAGGRTWHEPPF